MRPPKSLYEVTVRMKRIRLADGEGPYDRAIRSSADVAKLVRGLGMHEQPHESMLAIFLNVRNHVLGFTEVARGGTSGCVLSPADFYRAAISTPSCYAVVAVHNHPSSETAPSDEDVALTKRLQQAGELIGIKLLDHVIIGAGDNRYFSFLDAGLTR